jgi:hypothetical protein
VSPVELSRRRVLAGAGVLGAAAVAGLVVVPRLTDDDSASPEDTGADSGPPPTPGSPTEAIALVGAAYLAGASDENDEAQLRSLLPTLTAVSADELVDQFGTLQDPVQTDFAEDRTASVDGWILSLTEARAAALVHLVA